MSKKLDCSTVYSLLYSMSKWAYFTHQPHGIYKSSSPLVQLMVSYKNNAHNNKTINIKFMRSARDARDAGRESRHVTSAVHPGRSCEECVLCKKKDLSKFSHPKSWKDPSLLQQLQAAEPSLNVQPESCICLLCRRDVSNVNDVSFSPRWRKNTGIMKLICYIPNCTNTDNKTKLFDVQQLTPFFPVGHNDATFSNEDGTNNVPAHLVHSQMSTTGIYLSCG